MAPDRNAIEITLNKASLEEIDSDAARLEDMYNVYRTLRKITSQPGELVMDFNIVGGEHAVRGKGVTGDRLLADATRFRILRGIKEHVIEHVHDASSFELAFKLKCRELPEEIEIPELDLPGGGARPSQ